MTPVLITLIIVVAILGGYVIDYQKNKLKWQSKSKKSDIELDEMRKLMQQLKRRVENLEAIAAGDPSDFQETDNDPFERIVIDENDVKEKNRSDINNIVKNKGE